MNLLINPPVASFDNNGTPVPADFAAINPIPKAATSIVILKASLAQRNTFLFAFIA